jgi:hypothetical protein
MRPRQAPTRRAASIRGHLRSTHRLDVTIARGVLAHFFRAHPRSIASVVSSLGVKTPSDAR